MDKEGEEIPDPAGHRAISEELMDALILISEIPKRAVLPQKLQELNEKRKKALSGNEKKNYENIKMPAPPEASEEVRILHKVVYAYTSLSFPAAFQHKPTLVFNLYCIDLCTFI